MCPREVRRARPPGHIGIARRVYGDAKSPVVTAVAAQVGGVNKGAAVRAKFRYEGVGALPQGGFKGVRRGEVRGRGPPRHRGVAGGVHSDGGALVTTAAAEVRGISEGVAAGVELCHKGIYCGVVTTAWRGTPAIGLNGVDDGEVGRVSGSGDVGVSGRVHGDARAPVATAAGAAAQVGGVDQSAAVRREFRYKGIAHAPQSGLLGGSRWEVG